MVHSDARIERVLATLNASAEARTAALDLFESYDEFAAFFATIFADYPAGFAVISDLAEGRLRSGYGVEQDIVPTLVFLELAHDAGLAENTPRIASFFRMCIALHPHRAFDARTVSLAYDRIWQVDLDQFVVFQSYDILDLTDAFFVEASLVLYSLPLSYVVEGSAFTQYGAAALHAMYSHGVPIEYANGVESAYSWSENKYNMPPTFEVHKQFPRLAASLHPQVYSGQDAPAPAWHIVPLYLNLVPVEYAKTVVCRTASDTILLFEAGVPAEYVMQLGDLDTAAVLAGHKDGLAAEYLRELNR